MNILHCVQNYAMPVVTLSDWLRHQPRSLLVLVLMLIVTLTLFLFCNVVHRPFCFCCMLHSVVNCHLVDSARTKYFFHLCSYFTVSLNISVSKDKLCIHQDLDCHLAD